jgi:hypothetical protein
MTAIIANIFINFHEIIQSLVMDTPGILVKTLKISEETHER